MINDIVDNRFFKINLYFGLVI